MNRETKTTGALVLPAYGETESISKLLIELDSKIPLDWHFIIVDDSPTLQTANIVQETFKSLNRGESKLHLIKNLQKSGRGSAVQQGFTYAKTAIEFDFLIEMDSDGSHTAASVSEIVNAPQDQEFVIGSRYLSESIIEGWPIIRRIFSRVINIVLKRVFHIQLNDWTNGLRRYSARAISLQTEFKFRNKGFICLTEQVLLLTENGIFPLEIPTTFIERVHGSSTVTHTEIINSITGIFGLYSSRKKKY